MRAKFGRHRDVSNAGDATTKGVWSLCLYVAGKTLRASTAEAALRELCAEHLPGGYQLEVIDILERPAVAKRDQIGAIPTLVRRRPLPIKKIIGDLFNIDRVLMGLDLPPRTSPNSTISS